jgi:membrane protease YdiL (CAAX protease family)
MAFLRGDRSMGANNYVVLALSDWLLLATIVLVVPIYSYLNRRRLEKIADSHRRSLYLRSMAVQWLLALVTLFAWWKHARPFDGLGFTLPSGIVTTSAEIVCVMATIAVAMRLRKMAAWSPEKTAALRAQIGSTAVVIPRTKVELAWFFGVALTAGICEELLYRGYFFAVAAPYLTVYGAAVASAIVFALGHAYQGWRRMALVAAIGLFMGAFYVASGSIFFPMFLHVLIDINGGVSGYFLMRSES